MSASFPVLISSAVGFIFTSSGLTAAVHPSHKRHTIPPASLTSTVEAARSRAGRIGSRSWFHSLGLGYRTIQVVRSFWILTWAVSTSASLLAATAARADPHVTPSVDETPAAPHALPPAPFGSTWRLLTSDQKQQFVAGYLYGWRDSLKVSEVVLQFIRDNPTQAEKGMEKILSLYNVRNAGPELIVQELNSFFADPDNLNAPLSDALSVARARLRARAELRAKD